MISLVSVIIPAYNAADFLERTLQSALVQTYENLEIILVDDGSTDETGDIAREIALKSPKLRYFYKENGGVASARNFGIEAAAGDYLAFLDADDLWHPTKISRQMEALNEPGREPCDACFSLHRRIDTDDRVFADCGVWPPVDFTFTPHIVFHPVGNGSSLLVSRDAALEVGGFEEDYIRCAAGGCEDLDFELKIAARYPIRCVPEYHIGYRIYPGNMSSDRPQMARAFSMVVERHIARNPSLSAFCKKRALARAYAYSADNMFTRLQFADTVYFAYKLMRTDFSAFLALVVGAWPKLVVRRLWAVLNRGLRIENTAEARPRFVDLDPADIDPDAYSSSTRSMFERLAAEDGASAAARPPLLNMATRSASPQGEAP